MRLLGALAFVPLVASTAIAGVATSPDPIRPCISTFSDGLQAGAAPGGMAADAAGNVWATSGFTDHLIRINRTTKKITQWKVPAGTQAHDPFVKPDDGTVWFSGLKDRLVKFDPTTQRFTVFMGLPKGGQPHGVVWADDGNLYIGTQKAGRFFRLDLARRKFVEIRGLPPHNRIHGLIDVPGGGLWANLEGTDQIAHFDLKTQHFDRFVSLPPGSAPHQSAYDARRNRIIVVLLRSNRVAEYDLATHALRTYPTPLDPLKTTADIEPTARFPRLVAVAIDAKDQDAWITRLGIGVLRYNLDTRKVTQVTCGAKIPGASLVIIRAGDEIWFSDPVSKSFGRIDP
jgi:streptogramin lyase